MFVSYLPTLMGDEHPTGVAANLWEPPLIKMAIFGNEIYRKNILNIYAISGSPPFIYITLFFNQISKDSNGEHHSNLHLCHTNDLLHSSYVPICLQSSVPPYILAITQQVWPYPRQYCRTKQEP